MLPLPWQTAALSVEGGEDRHHSLQVSLQSAPGACVDGGFLGHWHTNWGPMELRREGDRIVGRFEWLGTPGALEASLPTRGAFFLDADWEAGGERGRIRLFADKSIPGQQRLAAPMAGIPQRFTNNKPLWGVCVPYAVTPSSLQGEWSYASAVCDDVKPPPIRVRVTLSGDTLTATAITGNPCIPIGQVVWRGRLRGETIEGEIFGRTVSDAPIVMDRVPALGGNVRIVVLDHAHIRVAGDSMTRLSR